MIFKRQFRINRESKLMKKLQCMGLALLFGAALLTTTSLKAADAKSYQVTGPVLELSATTITVQKGEEKWELARTKDTKITGDLKIGSKVTIYYTMVAGEVDVKEGKAKGKTKK
jgi:hypothetical protein